MKLWPFLTLAACQAPAAQTAPDWVLLEGTGTVLGLATEFQTELGAAGSGRIRTGTALGEEIVSDGQRVWARTWNNPVRELTLAERESALVQFAVLSGAWDDAGDSISFHSPAVARWKLLENRETGTSLAGGVGGIKAIRNGELEWFELGGRRFEAVSAQFYTEDGGAFADQDLDGNVGLGLLGHFRLIFDYGGGRMAFAPRS